MKKTEVLNFRTSVELAKLIDQTAKHLDINKTSLVEQALKDYIKQLSEKDKIIKKFVEATVKSVVD